jgi:hypothetical protein
MESNFNSGGAMPESVRREYNIFLDPQLVDPQNDSLSVRFIAEQFLLNSTKDCPLVDWHYAGLFRSKISVKNSGDINTLTFKASVTWDRYTPDINNDPNNPTNEFLSGSISRETVNQKISFQRQGIFTYNGGPKVDTEDPEVQGVDVSVPSLSFSIQGNYANGTFTIAFMQAVFSFVGKPNSKPWRGFSAGEVMLIGVDGDDSDTQYDSLTFNFEARPTERNITIPTIVDDDEETITIPEKRGYDYLWVRTIPREVTIAGQEVLVEVAQCAYVDQIYEYVDLNALLPQGF